jgi:hypothetical protein
VAAGIVEGGVGYSARLRPYVGWYSHSYETVTAPDLSDPEIRELDAWALDHLDQWADYRRWRVHFKMWDWFVHALDEHYRGGVDDYCYYLFVRSLLEPLIMSADPALSTKLTSWIAERDRRLLDSTNEDVEHVLSRSHHPGPEWWWSRIPKTGYLATYLREVARSKELPTPIGPDSDHDDLES